MTPQSAIAKGKELENYVVTQIREKGIDPKAYRSYGSGNGNDEKSDILTTMMILGQNAGFECKNHKTLAIPEWWRQTKKLEALGREPVLVFKIANERFEDTKCVIYLDTLLELVKNASGVRQIVKTSKTPRELKFKLQRAKQTISDALKAIEAYDET